MSKRKSHKTYDPRLRWLVIEIDYNEQDKGGSYGKRRIVSKPLTREKAEILRARSEEHHLHMVQVYGSKSHRSYILEATSPELS